MGRNSLIEAVVRHTLEETYENWDGYYLDCTNPNWEEELIQEISKNFIDKHP